MADVTVQRSGYTEDDLKKGATSATVANAKPGYEWVQQPIGGPKPKAPAATPKVKLTVKWRRRIDLPVWGMFLYEGNELSPLHPKVTGRISQQSGGDENPDVYVITVGAEHSPNNHTTALSLTEAKKAAQRTLERLLKQIINMDERPKMPSVSTEEVWQE